MPDDDAIIRLEGVHKRFDQHVVLDGVTLRVARGRTTVIIGPSGCGKSVLLKHMIGLLRPDRGKVYFEDQEVSAMGERAMVNIRRRIGFLFQGSALFDSMTVSENILFPMEEHEVGTDYERRRRVQEVLALVGLEGIEARYPEELSGGQKRRVALARAVALRPEVMLYDEPTTGLDPIRADLINELISQLQRAMRTTTVVVTHDMDSARKLADRIVMLYEGRFIADAPPSQLHTVKNEIVARFVEGRASDQELAELKVMQPRRNGGGRPGMEDGR
jgi:phospholipid/cholesterol/gamma-HCH transport system ATP-binding protein